MKNLLFAILDMRGRAIILSMIRQGYTDDLIAAKTNTSIEEVRKVRGKE